MQRRYEKRELTRQVDRVMADYIPEVMVSCRGESLNLVVNLTKNVEGGSKFVFKTKLQSRIAGGSRVYETRKKVKTKSDPDKFTMGQALKRADWHMFEKAKDDEDKQ